MTCTVPLQCRCPEPAAGHGIRIAPACLRQSVRNQLPRNERTGLAVGCMQLHPGRRSAPGDCDCVRQLVAFRPRHLLAALPTCRRTACDCGPNPSAGGRAGGLLPFRKSTRVNANHRGRPRIRAISSRPERVGGRRLSASGRESQSSAWKALERFGRGRAVWTGACGGNAIKARPSPGARRWKSRTSEVSNCSWSASAKTEQEEGGRLEPTDASRQL